MSSIEPCSTVASRVSTDTRPSCPYSLAVPRKSAIMQSDIMLARRDESRRQL